MKIIIKNNKLNVLFLDNDYYVPLFKNDKNDLLLTVSPISKNIIDNLDDFKFYFDNNYVFVDLFNYHSQLLPLIDFKSDSYIKKIDSDEFIVNFLSKKNNVIYGYYFLELSSFKLSNEYIWKVFENNIENIDNFDKQKIIENLIKIILIEHFKYQPNEVTMVSISI